MNAYPFYPSRKILVLDGAWDFNFIGDAELEQLDPAEFTFHDVMCVPGAFDCSPAYYCKRGIALYRTDFTLEQNMVLQRYWQPEFESFGFIKSKAVREYAERLIEQYDVRSGQGPVTITRSMSGGNQQKAIIAREIDKDPDLLVAVQPTRGLDVGAIEYIHSQLVAQRDKGKAVLLVSLELDEVMDVSDRILVMYEGELVGQLDPKTVSVEELGLYMAGAKRDPVPEEV